MRSSSLTTNKSEFRQEKISEFYIEMGRAFPLVVWPKFRMGQYWDDDREEALHFIWIES